jgi:hypothetical protein
MIMERPQAEVGNPPAARSNTAWRIVGELELPFCMDAHSMISAWLSEVLTPLQLHVGFLNKVLRSAEDAAGRAMRSEMVMKYQRTRLLIYVPADRPSNAQTWGFFHIEKVEPAVEIENSRAHSIEFYLYLEGQ